ALLDFGRNPVIIAARTSARLFTIRTGLHASMAPRKKEIVSPKFCMMAQMKRPVQLFCRLVICAGLSLLLASCGGSGGSSAGSSGSAGSDPAPVTDQSYTLQASEVTAIVQAAVKS